MDALGFGQFGQPFKVGVFFGFTLSSLPFHRQVVPAFAITNLRPVTPPVIETPAPRQGAKLVTLSGKRWVHATLNAHLSFLLFGFVGGIGKGGFPGFSLTVNPVGSDSVWPFGISIIPGFRELHPLMRSESLRLLSGHCVRHLSLPPWRNGRSNGQFGL